MLFGLRRKQVKQEIEELKAEVAQLTKELLSLNKTINTLQKLDGLDGAHPATFTTKEKLELTNKIEELESRISFLSSRL